MLCQRTLSYPWSIIVSLNGYCTAQNFGERCSCPKTFWQRKHCQIVHEPPNSPSKCCTVHQPASQLTDYMQESSKYTKIFTTSEVSAIILLFIKHKR